LWIFRAAELELEPSPAFGQLDFSLFLLARLRLRVEALFGVLRLQPIKV
jgi:hypothetical protein